MAAQLIGETEIIDVSALTMLVYGPPGVGKTTLAQTAEDPITLDLDRGAHRSGNRKAVMRFDTWKDIAEASAEIAKRKTVVVDTVGRALDMLAADIISVNAKHGTAAGGLSLQGYGALKARFGQWVGQLRLAGKDLIFLAHEKEEKDGDDRYMRPDIQGGSYTEVMKYADLVGYYLADRQGARKIDFNPSDRHIGKNAAGWKAMTVGDFATEPTFLAGLLADAKKRIGHTAEASAAAAKSVDEWATRLATKSDLALFNSWMPLIAPLPQGSKAQAWKLITMHADAQGWTFDAKAKAFVNRSREREPGEEG